MTNICLISAGVSITNVGLKDDFLMEWDEKVMELLLQSTLYIPNFFIAEDFF